MSPLIDRKSELSGLHLLIAEDDRSIRRLYKAFFSAKGARLDLAEDGAEAWEFYRNQPKYDIIITDFDMPKMSGLEMATKVYAHERDQERKTPIVIISGRKDIGGTTPNVVHVIKKGTFSYEDLARDIYELTRKG